MGTMALILVCLHLSVSLRPSETTPQPNSHVWVGPTVLVLPGLSSSPAWVDLLCLSLLDLCCFLLCSSCRRARLSCISSPPHPPIPPWGGVCGLRPTKALRVIRSTSDRWVAPDTHSWPPPPLLECGWLPPHCLCLLVVPGFSVLLPSCLIAPCIHYLLVLASPALISPAGFQRCRPQACVFSACVVLALRYRCIVRSCTLLAALRPSWSDLLHSQSLELCPQFPPVALVPPPVAPMNS